MHSSLGIGRKHIAPLLGEFVRQHPLIQIDLELSRLPLNISGTNFDIAIRVGGLSDPRLKAKLLARNRRIVCAAPSYFDSAPPLQTIRDLERHNCIVLRENNGDYSLWRFGEKGNEYVDVRGSMISDDGDVVTDWCIQGLGLIMRSTWHVNPMVQQGVLQQLSRTWGTRGRPLPRWAQDEDLEEARLQRCQGRFWTGSAMDPYGSIE